MTRIIQGVVAGGIAALCLLAAPAARADGWRGDRGDRRGEWRQDREEARARAWRAERERLREARWRLAREAEARRERERCLRESRLRRPPPPLRHADLDLHVDIGHWLARR